MQESDVIITAMPACMQVGSDHVTGGFQTKITIRGLFIYLNVKHTLIYTISYEKEYVSLRRMLTTMSRHATLL